MELLKLDVVECLLRSCFYLLHGGKSLSFECFFSLWGIKRNNRGLGLVNRVGGERRSIPDRPNTGSQTKLCELGRCHDGETNHPISTILGVFFSHSLLIASIPPSKIPVASEISSIVYRRSSLICSRIFSTFSSVRLVDKRPK